MTEKILIFEFVTGGGLSQQTIPESLAKEGLLMLKALIADFVGIPSIQLTVLLDWRCLGVVLPENIEVIVISNKQNVFDLLPKLIKPMDFIFPVAPEMNKILQKITVIAEDYNIQLLNSSSSAVEVCSDKLLIAQILQRYDLLTVKTIPLEQFSHAMTGQWVIKPRDGMGCQNTYLVSNKQEFDVVNKQIKSEAKYIIQPYIKGEILSLCCLFKDRKAWLICCNRQQMSLHKGEFELDACIVNIDSENLQVYQHLINKVASVISGLFGYVGIDIIHPEFGHPIILEINPRLTTSFVGINQAMGFNIAKTVFEMTNSNPIIKKTHNKQVTVSIRDF